MSRKENLLGNQDGRLTVIGEAESYISPGGHKSTQWLCKCECGNTKVIRSSSLKRKNKPTRSCGCLIDEARREVSVIAMNKANTKYFGEEKKLRNKASKARNLMIERCYNSKNDSYFTYGEIGITVCDRWRYGEDNKSGVQCLIDDIGYPPTLNHSIDRINPEGNYEPGNVRWLPSMKEQNRNKTNNHLLTYKDETKCIAEWAEEYNLPHGALSSRLRNGWTVEKALKHPMYQDKSNYRNVTINGKTQNIYQWCQELNIDNGTVYGRLNRGWDKVRALTTPARNYKKRASAWDSRAASICDVRAATTSYKVAAAA